ncbi:hypothetical protein TNIN_253981 [Trichonephila inaurata madagascariensis]|uniref:Uncharacterized protein n=1 Tax=Trichonephila inaurata madagascariensis TaxID=2747483 RepID=A0A8X6Y7U3_9ARAC|nr:hypothetical protein TNIN_253981 [Trichonephila inaurata madagascariensis]
MGRYSGPSRTVTSDISPKVLPSKICLLSTDAQHLTDPELASVPQPRLSDIKVRTFLLSSICKKLSRYTYQVKITEQKGTSTPLLSLSHSSLLKKDGKGYFKILGTKCLMQPVGAYKRGTKMP